MASGIEIYILHEMKVLMLNISPELHSMFTQNNASSCVHFNQPRYWLVGAKYKI